jgi:hypothetical protein
MSYGEPTLLPDYGRFVDLVNEVCSKTSILSFNWASYIFPLCYFPFSKF